MKNKKKIIIRKIYEIYSIKNNKLIFYFIVTNNSINNFD